MINLKQKSYETQENMTRADKVFLNTIVKRQLYVLKDLYTLHDLYPELIDKDVVGSLDSIYRLLADMSDSIIANRLHSL